MKISIYDLLGMIKDGKAPKKILWKDNVFGLSEDNKNYIDGDSYWLFIDYDWIEILNEPVEILETTITYKQDANYLKPQEATPYEPYIPPKKIEKLDYKLRNLENPTYNENWLMCCIEANANKINVIIDYINKEEK